MLRSAWMRARDGSDVAVAKDSNPACTTVPMWRLVSPTQLNSGGSRDWRPMGRREMSEAGRPSLGGDQSCRRRWSGALLVVLISMAAASGALCVVLAILCDVLAPVCSVLAKVREVLPVACGALVPVGGVLAAACGALAPVGG